MIATKARQSFDRGIGFLCFGAAFACPVVGSTAARGIRLLLGLVGLRFGDSRIVLTNG